MKTTILILLAILSMAAWSGTTKMARNQGPNLIDEALFLNRQLKGVEARNQKRFAITDDQTYIRRVMLDLTGRNPTPEQVADFLADTRFDKRRQLVDELLAGQAYVDRWSSFYGELFGNTSVIYFSHYRNAFHVLLRRMVAEDAGWDDIATEILTAQGNAGFNHRNAEEGVASSIYLRQVFEENPFRLDRIDDRAAFVTSTMLGVQTDCISCHNGAGHLEPVNKGLSVMTRDQFWGLAAFFAKNYVYVNNQPNGLDQFLESLQIIDLDDPGFSRVRFDNFPYADNQSNPSGEYNADTEPGDGMRSARSGGLIEPRYPFTGEGPQEGETRREALARIITSDRQFARNMVNRIWAHFMGSGFVEPLDGWDLGRLDPESAAAFEAEVQPRDRLLMEALTDYFIAENYNVRSVTRLIIGSRVYQADYRGNGDAEANQGLAYWTSNQRIRRLEGEAVVENIFQALALKRTYAVNGILDGPVDNLWQTPGTSDPNGFPYLTSGQEIDYEKFDYLSSEDLYFHQANVQDVLIQLGRDDRVGGQPRNHNPSHAGALTLLNSTYLQHLIYGFDINSSQPITQMKSPMVRDMVQRLAGGQLEPEQAVTTLYQRFLFRDPTENELEQAAAYLREHETELALPDLVWAMINHPEFLYK